MNETIKLKDSDIVRFLSKIKKLNSCWEWQGTIRTNYGSLAVRVDVDGVRKDREIRAHRLSYFIHKGPFDFKLHVCHSCDNPKCVNPDHLFLGTHQENMLDRDSKGRLKGHKGALGEGNAHSKLTEPEVIEIYNLAKSGRGHRSISLNFNNISVQTISHILRKRTWKYLTDRVDANLQQTDRNNSVTITPEYL